MLHGTKRGNAGSYFEQNDPSIHMLGLPKSRPRLGSWGVAAILVGTILALAVMMLESLQF